MLNGPSNLRDTGRQAVDTWVTLKFLVAVGQIASEIHQIKA